MKLTVPLTAITSLDVPYAVGVHCAMRFVETPIFTRLIRDYLDDDQYRSLEMALMLRPQHGVLIQGSGGLRKLRWGTGTRGKRGGLRIIYYWDVATETLYMLFAYSKNEQGDLTKAQVRSISRLVREEFG